VNSLLFLIALAAANTNDNASTVNEFEQYETCIIENAIRLEPTNEPAALVADSGIQACFDLKRKLTADFVKDPKRIGYMSVAEAGKIMTDFLNDTAAAAYNKAVLKILELRLDRINAKDDNASNN